MMLSDRNWKLKAVVEASPDRVFQCLVAMIQQAVRALGSEYDDAVAIDEAQRTITLTGHWWYQGVHTVQPHPTGSQVTYTVNNIAKVARTLAFLQRPFYEKEMRRDFKQMLRQIGEQAGCPWRLEQSPDSVLS